MLFPEPPKPQRPVRIGTSGYSFQDWVGPFYPHALRSADHLRYYAARFDCLEVNVTYYRVPDARLLASMDRRTPPGFDFLVKLHGDITHRKSRDRAIDRAFDAALAPLRDSGKLRGLLAQFPYGFKNTDANRAFLSDLRQRFPDEDLFVEFRNSGWNTDAVFDFLGSLGLGFVSVDEPPLPGLLPPQVRATTGVGYVRLHGRNAANWYAGAPGERDRGRDRYDYLYDEKELQEWAQKIRALVADVRQVYVFFNNCHAGQAPINAQAFRDLLADLA